jgi:anti-sigma factor RsiW
MRCDDVRELVSVYVDNELDLVHHARVEAHLGECAACSEARERVLALRDTVRGALSFELPPGLEDAVRGQLRRADRPRPSWLLKLAAVLLLGALLGFLLRPSTPSGLERELVASHVRSLMAEHLVDVVSSDRHTVKPWFEGKLDFAPPVLDLSKAGFELVGGRLDYLGGRQVAALVYKRRQHRINVFVWPSPGRDEARVQTGTPEGYTVLRWTHSGMSYAAISDLAADELEELVTLLERS